MNNRPFSIENHDFSDHARACWRRWPLYHIVITFDQIRRNVRWESLPLKSSLCWGCLSGTYYRGTPWGLHPRACSPRTRGWMRRKWTSERRSSEEFHHFNKKFIIFNAKSVIFNVKSVSFTCAACTALLVMSIDSRELSHTGRIIIFHRIKMRILHLMQWNWWSKYAKSSFSIA